MANGAPTGIADEQTPRDSEGAISGEQARATAQEPCSSPSSGP